MAASKKFTPPTYEEYVKATDFARIRYKWGLVVTIIATVLILALMLFVLRYKNEMTTHPLVFGAKQHNVVCSCYSAPDNEASFHLYVNSTTIENVNEGRNRKIDLSELENLS